MDTLMSLEERVLLGVDEETDAVDYQTSLDNLLDMDLSSPDPGHQANMDYLAQALVPVTTTSVSPMWKWTQRDSGL